MAKLFPCWDGLYQVTKAFPESSSHILDMQNMQNTCLSYHTSKLKCHIPNNDHLFSSWVHPEPGPILTEDGLEEHQIKSILDSKWQGHGWKYLIRWVGYGVEHDEWISAKYLKEMKLWMCGWRMVVMSWLNGSFPWVFKVFPQGFDGT